MSKRGLDISAVEDNAVIWNGIIGVKKVVISFVRKEYQVLKPIISLVLINMMNNFEFGKTSSKMFFKNKPMLVNKFMGNFISLSIYRNNDIPRTVNATTFPARMVFARFMRSKCSFLTIRFVRHGLSIARMRTKFTLIRRFASEHVTAIFTDIGFHKGIIA